MLKFYAFHRFIMFLNEQIKYLYHISSPQINQINNNRFAPNLP